MGEVVTPVSVMSHFFSSLWDRLWSSLKQFDDSVSLIPAGWCCNFYSHDRTDLILVNQGYEEDEEEDAIVERVASAVHVLAELVLSEREAYVKVTNPAIIIFRNTIL